jgi:hypothetical protein
MFKTKDPVEFLWYYAEDKNGKKVYKKETLEKKVQAHLQNKMCRIILDQDSNICACCFWSIDPDCVVATVTDLVIREDYKDKDLMRRILIDGLKIWPVQFIKYRRDYTENEHEERPQRVWSVERFLRRKV